MHDLHLSVQTTCDVFRVIAFRACIALLIASCTAPNPHSCADGTCTDPALPFCDVDGTLQGHPQTCIAVTCAPGSFVTCRSDDALTCNFDGNDYDIKTCSHHCVPEFGGCIDCLADSECADPTPHCDVSTHSCRGCIDDRDCASGVCDLASQICAPASQIIHASPTGSDVVGCGSESMPCTLSRALLSVDATRNVIKLATGVYTSTVTIMGRAVMLDGPGATILQSAGAPALSIGDGGNVRLQGLTLVSPQTGIECNTMGAVAPTFALEQVTIQGLNGPVVDGVRATVCTATIEHSAIHASNIAALVGDPRSDVTIRRSTIDGGTLFVGGGKFHVSNSMLRNASDLVTQFSGGPTDIAFSTIVNSPINCGGSGEAIRFSNNIIYSASTGDVVTPGNGCAHHYELLTPQSADPTVSDHIMRNLDPKFVDANGDFHLVTGSPAIDAADPAASESSDFDGTPRPQGAGRDLGAFELKP